MKKFLMITFICLFIIFSFRLFRYETKSSEPIIKEYEVMSIYQYMNVKTNNFGAILDQDLKYCFTYMGDDGQLHQFDDFEHTEYGAWKLCIGKENKYIVQEYGLNTYRYLYLTKETLANMEIH